eukprot:scaffold1.g5269.t1
MWASANPRHAGATVHSRAHALSFVAVGAPQAFKFAIYLLFPPTLVAAVVYSEDNLMRLIKSPRQQQQQRSKTPAQRQSSSSSSSSSMVATRRAKQRALVTGGSGFLGRHLVQQLLDSGKYEVTVFDIRRGEEAEREGLSYVIGDLRKPEDVAAAAAGQDVVFHVATAAPTAANTLNEGLMRAVNVDGTAHVIDACVAVGVPRLVYTSSASVVFDGRDLLGTKIDGEKLVLAANGRGGLATAALRPSGIFGEHDLLTVPTTVAHLLAADALAGGPGAAAAGQAFFVTNDEPRRFWGFLGDVCEGLGYGRPRIRLPFHLVYLIALLVHYVVTPLLALVGVRLQSDFTPFRITVAASNRTFSCAKARRLLGYTPAVGMDEALRRTLAAFQHLHASNWQPAGDKGRTA